jgi:hypothetical protein
MVHVVHVVTIQRMSAAGRAEEIFREVFPDAPAVPELHELHLASGPGDYHKHRATILRRFEDVAPGEWEHYWSVLLVED